MFDREYMSILASDPFFSRQARFAATPIDSHVVLQRVRRATDNPQLAKKPGRYF
jgi:hypothetical protein